jgi:hypothetical protein
MAECKNRRSVAVESRGYVVARVQHFGPFIGLDLAPRAAQEWVLGPFPGLFESSASVSAHPWPQPSGAEIAVTAVRSEITPAGQRSLWITVQNIYSQPLDGYNIWVTLTSSAARARSAN